MTSLVDMAGVARITGLTYQTVRHYRARGILPEPDFMVGGSPAWMPDTIESWLLSQSFKPRGPRTTRSV